MRLAILGLLFLSINAFATDGGDGSGGGTQIESAFRLRAYEMIGMVRASHDANALCANELLLTTINTTRIDVVDALMSDGQPIRDRNFDAYTTPLHIQLLKPSWKGFFEAPSAPVRGRSVDALILHETLRATGGACDDEGFVLSTRMMSYFREPAHYSQIFEFRYKTELAQFPGWWELKPQVVCVNPVVIGQENICAGLFKSRHWGGAIGIAFGTITSSGSALQIGDGISDPIRYKSSGPNNDEGTSAVERYEQAVNSMTEEESMYLTYDRLTGYLAWGLDPAVLNRLP